MESGSSGSFQSSSGGVGGGGGGGDEEYDSSRGESISTFMNSQQQLFLSHHQQQRNPFFHPSSDHHSQNLDASLFLQNANFQQQHNNNEEMGWSRGFVRSSESNYGNFGNFSLAASAASSLPSSSSQHLISTQGGGRMINQNPLPDSLLNSGGGSGGGEAINIPTTAANQPPPPLPPDVVSTKSTTNPKKRTRASRRAPTTVLTTDTNNFRQMVQEFTGIPAAPFSANPGGSTFGRRLDLFSSVGASASMRGGHQLDHLSSFYPLRPSAQKLTPSSSLLAPPLSSSSLLSSSLMMNNAIGNPNSNNASISINTLGLPQHLKHPHHNQNIVSMQNQLLNFGPSVQSSISPSIFNSATRPHHEGSSGMNILPSLDELGSFINQQRSSEEVERQASWRDDQGGRNLNNEGQDGQHQLGSNFDGN